MGRGRSSEDLKFASSLAGAVAVLRASSWRTLAAFIASFDDLQSPKLPKSPECFARRQRAVHPCAIGNAYSDFIPRYARFPLVIGSEAVEHCFGPHKLADALPARQIGENMNRV
jgi:hypothetical protein